MATSKSAAAPTVRRSRPDKRLAIMQAAEKLFTSRRLHEITLDDVARDAAVGKGTIYRYFRDKDDLFFQIATQGFDELCDLLQQRVPGDAPFADQLLSACRAITGFFEQRRQLFRMMQTEDGRISWCSGSLRQRWLERRTKLRKAVAAILLKGLEESAVRPGIDPDVAAGLLLGLLRTWAREMSDDARRPGLEVVVELFIHGVAPLQPAPAASSQRRSVR